MVVIAANCQANAIAKILEQVTVDAENTAKRFEVLFCKPIYELAHDESVKFIAALKKADVLLYQPHKGGAKTPEWRTSQYWINETSAKHCISFPSIYFSGYNPELTYLRKPNGLHLNEGFVDYHDKRIVKLFLEEMPVEKVAANYQRLQPGSVDIQKNLDASFEEMQSREIEFELAIRLTNFIQSNYKKERLFYTFNHPSNTVLYEVVRQLLQILSMPDAKIYPINRELLKYDVFPIVNGVYKSMGLEFQENGDDYIIQNQALTKDQVTKRYFSIYTAHHQQVQLAVANSPRADWLERKKLIIHIGMSKTGTTSLQKTAHNLTQQLEKVGLLYPQAGLETVNHLKLLRHFSGTQTDNVLLQRFKNEVAQSRAKAVLVSCEGFEGLGIDRMRQMANQLQEYDVYILCGMRNRISWVRSYYGEVVKKAMFTGTFPMPTSSFAEPEGVLKKVLDKIKGNSRQVKKQPVRNMLLNNFQTKAFYGSTLLDWVQVFLKERVFVCNIDKENIWKTIENISGLKLAYLFEKKDKARHNTSPSVLTIELARRFYIEHDLKDLNYGLASHFVVAVERMIEQKESAMFNSYFESEKQLKGFVRQSIDDEFILRNLFDISLLELEQISNIRYLNASFVDDLYQQYKKNMIGAYQSVGGQI